MHERVWGKGAGKIMPANGAQLLATEAYRRTLTALDEFVAEMVPGARKRIAGQAAVSNRAGKSCGSLPNQTGVTVTDAKPKEKPGFSRIYRPADRVPQRRLCRPRWLLRAAGQSARSLSSR